MRKGIRMVAGIPGTGIGGIFYLLIALWMPIRELYLTVRKQGSSERWHIAKGHILLTLWVIVGMWAMGEFLGMLLHHSKVISKGTQNILHIAPFFLTLATLVAVYLGVHGLRLYVSHVEKPKIKSMSWEVKALPEPQKRV